MSEDQLCACCGNRKGCDCYSTQSPQFRQLAEAQARITEVESHNKSCHYCGAPCDNLAANPGLWAVGLCHADEPGVVKWHHIGCVSAKLADGQKADVEVQEIVGKYVADNERLTALVEHLQSWRDKQGAFHDLTNPEASVQPIIDAAAADPYSPNYEDRAASTAARARVDADRMADPRREAINMHWEPHFYAEIRDGQRLAYYNALVFEIVRRDSSPRREAMEHLWEDVAGATPEFEDPRVRYVTVQVNRKTWEEIQRLAALDNESDLLPPATGERLAAQFDAMCKADTGLVEDREEDHASD
jgi:hypothetical protein